MSIILKAEELTKTINQQDHEQPILDGINLTINQGEYITVMGPSGSGKSTLLYLISGMDRATKGKVTFHDQALQELTETQLARVRLMQMGFIFQHMHLLKNLNVRDNIILSGYMAKKVSREHIKARAKLLMERVGILHLQDREIQHISGGQLQRVAICRALINKPEILFGDEPTGALNSKATKEILHILQELNESGTTMLIVTHDAFVAAHSERVLYMLDGRIKAETHLGKYKPQEQDINEREQQLKRWLTNLQF